MKTILILLSIYALCYMIVALLMKITRLKFESIDFLYCALMTFALPFAIVGFVCAMIIYGIFTLCDLLNNYD